MFEEEFSEFRKQFIEKHNLRCENCELWGKNRKEKCASKTYCIVRDRVLNCNYREKESIEKIADEWHYVEDKDLPEGHKPILISDVFGHCESGYYFNGDWFGRDVMFHDVFAWRECPPQSERMKLACEAILTKGREGCKNQDL